MNEDNNENDITTTAPSVLVCVIGGNTLHAVISTGGTENPTAQVCLGSAAIALGNLSGVAA